MDNRLQLDITFIKQHRVNLILMVKKVITQLINFLFPKINCANNLRTGIHQ